MPLEQILVVDDEAMVRQLAARILKEQGYRVVEAPDGVAALDMLDGSAVDLVLSDVIMPRLTGVELMERLSLTQPGLPVLLMSGYGTTELLSRGVSAPCGLLPKPFPPDRLIEEVRRCLRDWRERGAPTGVPQVS